MVLAVCFLRFRDNLVDEHRRNVLVAKEFGNELTATARQGTKFHRVRLNFRKGNFRRDNGTRAFRVRTHNSAATLVDVAHNVTEVIGRNSNLQAVNGFEKNGLCILQAFFKRDGRRHLEGKLVRVNVVITSVVKDSLQAGNGIARKRSISNVKIIILLFLFFSHNT